MAEEDFGFVPVDTAATAAPDTGAQDFGFVPAATATATAPATSAQDLGFVPAAPTPAPGPRGGDSRDLVTQSLLDHGATPVAAAAILGDIQQESEFNPHGVGDHGSSFGLLQVGGPMFRQFQADQARQGISPDDPAYTYNQTPFVLNKFKQQHPDRWDAMQNADSAPQALQIFRGTKDWGYGIAGKRYQYAQNYQQALSGVPVQNVDTYTRVEKAVPVTETEHDVARALPVNGQRPPLPAGDTLNQPTSDSGFGFVPSPANELGFVPMTYPAAPPAALLDLNAPVPGPIARAVPVVPQGIIQPGPDTGAYAQPEQLTPDQIAAQQTDVGFGPGVAPPYPEGSPGYQDIQRARPLLATEIPSATAQAPTLQESIAASLPQVAPTGTSQRIPLAPYGGYAPTTAPEAYHEAGGGIAGVINAIDFTSKQPVIDQGQAQQIMHLAAGGARTAARLTGQADVEQGMEENLSQTLSGFTTPEAMAQLALLKNPVARALLAGQQLSQVPEDIANIARAYKSGDKKELGRAIASASVNATMGVSMAAEPLGITAGLQSRAADTALERGQITDAEHAQLTQYYNRPQQPVAAGATAPAPVAAPVEAGVSPAAQAPAAPAAASAGGFGWENIQLPGAEAAPAPGVPTAAAAGAPVGQLAPREIQNIATAERYLKSGQLTPAEYDATVVANLGPERAKAWPTGEEVLNPPDAGAPEAPRPAAPVEAGVPPAAAPSANLPDWMNNQIDALSAPLEANGVANQIEDLAAQRLTAKQIANKLGLPVESVIAVRTKRGIPSMNVAGPGDAGGGAQLSPEFQAWAAAREARAPAPMPVAPTAALETAANDQPGATASNVVDTAVKTMPEPQGDTVPADAGATQSIPLDQMATRPELMQYKRMDDQTTGTTEQDRLTGEYDPHKAGIMLLWEPNNPKEYGLKGNQKYIVANGHYRYDFFSRQGVPATDAKILRQSDGYSAGDARAKAAEVNIADGKGTIFDQANFIREQAAAHGQDAALGRARQIGARGQKAATIALQSGPDLYTSFINEKITPDAAATIAETAPGNEPLQRLGLQYALQGENPQDIANYLQSKQARAGTATPTAKQVDLFGTDDTAAQEDIANGKRAGAIQKELSDQINTVAGAARRPEKAAALGVNVKDPKAVAAKLQNLRVLRERARRWAFDPQIRDVVYRDDLSPEEAVSSLQEPTPVVGTAVTPTTVPEAIHAKIKAAPQIQKQIDTIVRVGADRMAKAKDSAILAQRPTEDDWLTSEEKASLQRLKAKLPTAGEERVAAQARVMAKRAAAASGTAPALRPGEKAGELFQGADQPFNLAGETGLDFPARQKAAEGEAAAKAAAAAQADQAQTQLFSIDPLTRKRHSLADDVRKAFTPVTQRTPEIEALQSDLRTRGFRGNVEELQSPASLPGLRAGSRGDAAQVAKAETLARIYKAPLTWFRADEPLPIGGKELNRRIFLNVDMAGGDPAQVVTAHELGHYLYETAPDLHRELFKALMQAGQRPAAARAYREALLERGYSPADIAHEFVSDFMAETLRDPAAFTRALGEKPTLMRRVISRVKDFLDRTIIKLGLAKTPTATALIDDLSAARTALEQTLQSARERAGAPGETPKSSTGFAQQYESPLFEQRYKVPSQEDLEDASASDDRQKMRGHIATIKRMDEVSPDVKTRIAMAMYDPSSSEVLNRAANAIIDEKGLDRATLEATQKPPNTDAEMAMHHNLAVRLDQLGEATADPAAKGNLFDQAAMVRDNMVKGATTPAQALAYIRTIGKTSPEGLIRTAQKLMTEMIKPEDKALLDQINRLRAEIAKLKDPKARAAATKIVIQQAAKVNKPGQRLTPAQVDELLTKHAEGNLDQNQFAQTIAKYFKIPRLSEQNIARIKAAQKAWNLVPDSNPILKQVRAADMMDTVYGLIPRRFWEKVRAASVLSMITHGKLPVRIGASYALRLVGNTVADAPMTILADMGNVFSGRRTLTAATVRGIFEGLYDPIRAYRAGYTDAKVRDLGTWSSFKEGMHSLLTRGSLINKGMNEVTSIRGGTHTFSSRFGRMAENVQNLLHNALPLAFYDAAYRSSLYRQMARANVAIPDADMLFNAQVDANEVASNNPTVIYHVAKGLRNILDLPTNPKAIAQTMKTGKIASSPYGLGTALTPFALKPASLLTEGLNWTPLGVGRAAYELRGLFSKGEPIRPELVGRALVKAVLGTGLAVGGGYQLAKLGILTGAPDDNKDLEAMRKASGWGAYKINVSELKRRVMSGDWWSLMPFTDTEGKRTDAQQGDYITNYNWLEPVALPVAIGADLAQKEDKRQIDVKRGKLPVSALAGAAAAGIGSLVDNPMLQGIQQLAQAVGEKDYGRMVAQMFSNVPGNFVPALVRQTGQYIDNTVRETRGTMSDTVTAGRVIDREASNILAQIPGLAQRYPAKYDAFGEAVQRYNYGNNSTLNVFFNPAMISQFKSNPQLAEMERLYSATGSTKGEPANIPAVMTINGKQVELTNEQLATWDRYVGKESSAVITRLLASPQFAAEPMGVKQAVMANVLSAVNKAAKIDLFGQSPVSVGMGMKGPTLSQPSPMDIAMLVGARRAGLKQSVMTPGPLPAQRPPLWRVAPPAALPSLAP